MESEANIQKLFDNLKNKEALNFIDGLNITDIPNAVTGSGSLFIHGNFGREPNDFDLYTTEEHLKKEAEERDAIIEEVAFPPVHWIEMENLFGVQLLAKLECMFDDGRYYDFSYTDLLGKNISKFKVNGVIVHVVPPEEVLLLKLTAPRKNEKKDDIADVENYLTHNTLNKDYLKVRAEEIGIQNLENIKKYLK